MQLPTKFYRVVAKGAGSKLRMSEPGSKTYANEKHARAHLDSLRARGVECSLYESETVVWHEVVPAEAMPGSVELPLDFDRPL